MDTLGVEPSLTITCSVKNIDCVALQEMIKSDFSILDLKLIDSWEKIAWQWVTTSSLSGGILLGVDKDLYSVSSWTKGRYFLSASIATKATGASWELCVVYGPTDHSWPPSFHDELRLFVSNISGPIVVGGDFNLIKEERDKSSGNICRSRMQLFNDTLADLELRVITGVGAHFMWTNHQIDPI